MVAQGTSEILIPELRSSLRLATRAVHDRIEQYWTRQGGFRSEEAYLRFLSVLLRVHSAIGMPAAQTRGCAEEVSEETRRITALCRDLSVERSLPAPDPGMSFGQAWGVGYVLNGRTRSAHIRRPTPAQTTCRDRAPAKNARPTDHGIGR
jgi:heme oxygenase